MEIKTNGEYNACQYGLTTNLSPDGKVLSKSEMIVLRGETPEEVHKAFQKLQTLINGKEDKPKKKVKNSKKEIQKTKQETEGEKEQKKDNLGTCPECGGLLVEKQGVSSKTLRPYHFISCGNWPACSYSRPFISEAEKHAPCDEEIPIEAIPF